MGLSSTNKMGNKYYLNVEGKRIELHDVDKYNRAMQIIRNVETKINSLEGTLNKTQVRQIARELSSGILNVVQEIYAPLIDEEKRKEALSTSNDYKTDFEEVNNIPDRFK